MMKGDSIALICNISSNDWPDPSLHSDNVFENWEDRQTTKKDFAVSYLINCLKIFQIKQKLLLFGGINFKFNKLLPHS